MELQLQSKLRHLQAGRGTSSTGADAVCSAVCEDECKQFLKKSIIFFYIYIYICAQVYATMCSLLIVNYGFPKTDWSNRNVKHNFSTLYYLVLAQEV